MKFLSLLVVAFALVACLPEAPDVPTPSDVLDGTKDMIESTTDAVVETAGDATDIVVETMEDGAEAVQEAGEDAMDAAADAMTEEQAASDAIEEGLEEESIIE